MLKLISVLDTVTAAYLNPNCARTTAEALRMFESACKDPNCQFSKHPSDYSLFELGEFDELSGRLLSYEIPRLIARATEFVPNGQFIPAQQNNISQLHSN